MGMVELRLQLDVTCCREMKALPRDTAHNPRVDVRQRLAVVHRIAACHAALDCPSLTQTPSSFLLLKLLHFPANKFSI